MRVGSPAVVLALAVGSAGCVPAPPSLCGDGLTQCNDPSPLAPLCVDLRADELNCGSCGAVCPLGATCAGGRCACPAGEAVCPGGLLAGRCVDLSSDASSCGTCGLHCGAGSCVQGACVCAASPGVVGCSGSPACADTSSDPWNCGGCGVRCPLLGEACVDGVCACPAARPDVCPVGPSDGCVDLRSDPRHCGTCATACLANGVCEGGACACPAGTTPCPAGNVCATLASDAANCGACGVRCDGVCANGTCVPAPPEVCGLPGYPCCPGQLCYSGTCNGFDCW